MRIGATGPPIFAACAIEVNFLIGDQIARHLADKKADQHLPKHHSIGGKIGEENVVLPSREQAGGPRRPRLPQRALKFWVYFLIRSGVD